MELKEAGLDVGERRVGRLMQINSIKPIHLTANGLATSAASSTAIMAINIALTTIAYLI
jgi:putative transposase